ncbi:uncharacterized protein MYCFIDRAFT_176822 [Pseudocercospora fijiensis CIRAD86]|uniref:Uncharacterized protein n=1 Tax=Pseudocercospora fijiensis (strain CIRAD86) TaxID=383855 RepID=M2ZR49_PSEFD|nr:uncharacterized protein MYCFIDRAFT_176822 [Pseudocercospora fijiensis CIRAD86]EME81534.1 hypothetical protein MYCFIDRAFT_176822 [Pseudocercospora fijiensis CIRAD86]
MQGSPPEAAGNRVVTAASGKARLQCCSIPRRSGTLRISQPPPYHRHHHHHHHHHDARSHTPPPCLTPNLARIPEARDEPGPRDSQENLVELRFRMATVEDADMHYDAHGHGPAPGETAEQHAAHAYFEPIRHWGLGRKQEAILFYGFAIPSDRFLRQDDFPRIHRHRHRLARVMGDCLASDRRAHGAASKLDERRSKPEGPEAVSLLVCEITETDDCASMNFWRPGNQCDNMPAHLHPSISYWLVFLLFFIFNTVGCVMNAYNNITWECDRLHYEEGEPAMKHTRLAILGIPTVTGSFLGAESRFLIHSSNACTYGYDRPMIECLINNSTFSSCPENPEALSRAALRIPTDLFRSASVSLTRQASLPLTLASNQLTNGPTLFRPRLVSAQLGNLYYSLEVLKCYYYHY